MRLHFLAACHNRRKQTIASMKALNLAARRAEVDFDITVYDDGSTDGTDAALLENFPDVEVIRGTGFDFWAKSMSLAEAKVLGRPDVSDEDYLVWLNDDVLLDEDSLERMFKQIIEFSEALIVGAMRGSDDSSVTYSGLVRDGVHPLNYRIVQPDLLQEVGIDSFNGNLVFVPVKMARSLGGIDGGFTHAFADIDYGIRSSRSGARVLLAPGTYGRCDRNPPAPAAPIMAEWRAFVGTKGSGNPRSTARLLKRVAPASWPLFWMISYALWWVRAVRRHAR